MVTDRRALAELLYPGNLPDDVYTLAAQGKSIRAIADIINQRLRDDVTTPEAAVVVSRDSLRRWYYSPTTEGAEGADSSLGVVEVKVPAPRSADY